MHISSVEIYSDATNAAIIRHPDRRFPGVLIQGDTLNILARTAISISESVADQLSEDEAVEARDLADQLMSLGCTGRTPAATAVLSRGPPCLIVKSTERPAQSHNAKHNPINHHSIYHLPNSGVERGRQHGPWLRHCHGPCWYPAPLRGSGAG
jgi:hypothetical protein